MTTPSKKYILGLSFSYHDSAAALIEDGILVSAAQEERFTRIKHDEDFPHNAVEYCLISRGITIQDVAYVVFYDKPLIKFERLITSYINTWPHGLSSFLKAMLVWLKSKLWIEKTIREALGKSFKGEVLYTEHHYAHAASAYYSSSFYDSVIITMDGVGEKDTTTIGYAHENSLRLTHTIEFPHSLGLLYSALTYYLGFKVNSAEYKVMGLAPYGNPDVYYSHFNKIIDIKDDGSFRLSMKYFAYEYALKMITCEFEKLFNGPARDPESPLTQKEKDIAAALQKITEEIVLKIALHAKKLYKSDNLCLSGGVALNCVANGKILEKGIYKNIFIQPASGDAGGAAGAALYVHYEGLKNAKKGSAMPSIYLGPEYSNKEIQHFLDTSASNFTDGKKPVYTRLSENDLYDKVATLISGNNAIGWFQGRMEFGPRALGNRSIIGDPRNKENWQKINLKVKFRESFRPFAPSILEEELLKYFDIDVPSPYMLLVANVRGDGLPAITHVDNSARIQSVTSEQNERYYKLISAFKKQTGCPVVINTSFNVRGEPIVLSPEHAFISFLNTDIDYLVMGNILLSKKENFHLINEERRALHLEQFKLD